MIDIRNHGIGIGGGSNIKKIQHITRNLGSYASLTLNLGINKVNIDNTIVLLSYTGNWNTPNNLILTAQLNSDSLVTVRPATDNSNTPYGAIMNITVTVIEFNNVKSVQRGSYSSTTDKIRININPIKVDNSLAFVTHRLPRTTGAVAGHALLNFYFSDNTTLFINGVGESADYEWQVIEFK